MTKKRRTILIITVILTGTVIAAGITVHLASKPNFAKMNPRQIRQYFDSNQFRDANEQTRREIRGEMAEAMQARMEARVNDYFALAEGKERTAYLDKIIAEMQARRAEFLASRDPNRPRDSNRPFDPNRFARFGPPDANGRPRFSQRGANGRQRPPVNPERMRARSDRMNADTRVKMTQFRRDLQNRMQQRGIQMPTMGPGGARGLGGGPARGFGPPG